MVSINPASIKNMDQYSKLAFIEDGQGNWHHAVFVDKAKKKILFVENNMAKLTAAVVSPAEYGWHIRMSNWI